MCSNNYLGLANHPLARKAAIEAIERYGVGSGASRLISGTMTPHRELEERLKEFTGKDTLLFNSGYHANTGIIPALAGRQDAIFSDRLNHASIIDGALLSRAELVRYPHRDVDSLERLIKKSRAKGKFVITEGVFSMEGDTPPLREISSISSRYGATLIVDDAHGFGVMGKAGRGTPEHFSMDPPAVYMGTLGKALGACGAFVSAEKNTIDLLLNRARTLLYSTALPPSVCAATIKALEILKAEPERRKKLRRNASAIRKGLGVNEGAAPIIALIVGDAGRTMRLAELLLEKGVFVQGIREPTVPEGTSRLRITVTSEHTESEVSFAISAIKAVMADETLS
jgi:glycine C-acetyltransferase